MVARAAEERLNHGSRAGFRLPRARSRLVRGPGRRRGRQRRRSRGEYRNRAPIPTAASPSCARRAWHRSAPRGEGQSAHRSKSAESLGSADGADQKDELDLAHIGGEANAAAHRRNMGVAGRQGPSGGILRLERRWNIKCPGNPREVITNTAVLSRVPAPRGRITCCRASHFKC